MASWRTMFNWTVLLILTALVAIAWFRSHTAGDVFLLGGRSGHANGVLLLEGQATLVISNRMLGSAEAGVLRHTRLTPIADTPTGRWTYVSPNIGVWLASFSFEVLNGELRVADILESMSFAGVSILSASGGDSVDRWHDTMVSVPIAYALLPVAVWAGILARRAWRIRKAMRAGLCRRCGYDLRASPERCPECGEPVTAGNETTPDPPPREPSRWLRRGRWTIATAVGLITCMIAVRSLLTPSTLEANPQDRAIVDLLMTQRRSVKFDDLGLFAAMSELSKAFGVTVEHESQSLGDQSVDGMTRWKLDATDVTLWDAISGMKPVNGSGLMLTPVLRDHKIVLTSPYNASRSNEPRLYDLSEIASLLIRKPEAWNAYAPSTIQQHAVWELLTVIDGDAEFASTFAYAKRTPGRTALVGDLLVFTTTPLEHARFQSRLAAIAEQLRSPGQVPKLKPIRPTRKWEF